MVLSTLKMLNKHFLMNELMLNAFPRNNVQATLSEEGMWQASFAKFLQWVLVLLLLFIYVFVYIGLK